MNEANQLLSEAADQTEFQERARIILRDLLLGIDRLIDELQNLKKNREPRVN